MSNILILDLPTDDIVYTQIFPHLSLEDIVHLRSAGFVHLVDRYISKMKYIDWDLMPPSALKMFSSATSNLREVDVSSNFNIKDDNISLILDRNRLIRTLILRHCGHLTLEGTRPMVNLQYLIKLNLRNNSWVTNSFLHILTMNLNSDLRYIDLSMCPVGDSSLIPFFRKFQKLKDIDLEKIPLLSDATLYVIAEYSQNLVNFNIMWNRQLGELALRAVVISCMKLNTLMTFGCYRISKHFRESVRYVHYCE